ncbi:MAG TPA: MmcQ/YjbR family DNA-binding protein, partial [Flavobacteriales bacterium]|nr:MmcQ/YjbR family DNA-binding protein [Flavobacteriales bacterium]
MVSVANFKKLTLSLGDVVELPHFERTSFRVNKKIFATLDEKKQLACLMLDPVDQSTFCTYDKSVIYPVPNKWGLKGATYIELKKVPAPLLKDALT